MSVKKPKVLFATFEAVPFVKTGGLGDVGGTPSFFCVQYSPSSTSS